VSGSRRPRGGCSRPSISGAGRKCYGCDQDVIAFGLAVVLSYVYAFVGGFTDAANAIATSAGTRALSRGAAVVTAGVFNLVGGLRGTAVALPIGTGLVEPGMLSLVTVVATSPRGS
jgi:phosphate/sulfate permease